jgi:hypothetical protein
MHALIYLIVASAVLLPQGAARDSLPLTPSRGPLLRAAFPSFAPALQPRGGAPAPQRPKAVEFSDAYYTRAAIHRYASYATIPLFVTEYAIGRSLYNQPGENESLRSWHSATAAGIYALFAVNTVTGGWNLWEARAVKEGRTRRYVHSGLMFASGAGFVATAMLAPGEEEGGGGAGGTSSQRQTHRTVAIASMSTALVGYLMMLVWKD